MAKKISTRAKKSVKSMTLELTLNDLKKITAAGSSFGGDTWQQIYWGKDVTVGLEPFPGPTSAVAKKLAKERVKKTT